MSKSQCLFFSLSPHDRSRLSLSDGLIQLLAVADASDLTTVDVDVCPGKETMPDVLLLLRRRNDVSVVSSRGI